MAKTILGDIPVLPDISMQIEYVAHIRKDVIPCVKPLQSELPMIQAIEQSLIGLKREFQAQSKERRTAISSNPPLKRRLSRADRYNQILNSFDIPLTSIRVHILAIIHSLSEEFTITEIFQRLSKKKGISKSAVTATLDLFSARGLLVKMKASNPGSFSGKRGRPETLYRFVAFQNEVISSDYLPRLGKKKRV